MTNLKIDKGFVYVGTRTDWPFGPPASNTVIDKDVRIVMLPDGVTPDQVIAAVTALMGKDNA